MVVQTFYISGKLIEAYWCNEFNPNLKDIGATGVTRESNGKIYEVKYIKYKRFKNKKL